MNYEYNAQNRELYQMISPFLHDEEVLWIGQPYASVRYRPNLFITVFALFWLGFAVFWTVSATAMGGLFGLFGIPFVCVGVFMLYTFFIGQRKQFAGTVYAVTDRRAIIVTNGRHGTNCTEFIFRNLQTVNLTSVKGTAGTICFVPQTVYYREPHRRYYSYTAPAAGTSFLMIDHVQEVYRLISEHIST